MFLDEAPFKKKLQTVLTGGEAWNSVGKRNRSDVRDENGLQKQVLTARNIIDKRLIHADVSGG